MEEYVQSRGCRNVQTFRIGLDKAPNERINDQNP